MIKKVGRPLKQAKSFKDNSIKNDFTNPYREMENFEPSKEIVEPYQPVPHILVGLTVVGTPKKNVLTFPVEIPPPVNDTDKNAEIEELIVKILGGEPISMTSNEMFYLSLNVIKNPESAKKIHSMISQKLSDYAKDIPKIVSDLKTINEIGGWVDVMGKINIISTSFAPICLREFDLFDFHYIFRSALTSAFTNHRELFQSISHLIIEGYKVARENNDIAIITPAFTFVKESGLFSSDFIPLLISTIIEIVTPIFDERFGQKLSVYLNDSVKISEQEKAFIEPLVTPHVLTILTAEMSKVIFAKRLHQICENGLTPLVQNNDSDSIDLCAKFARNTDTITSFTRQLSFVFEAEAESCFKLPDPIPEILKLHKTLTNFSEKSFSAADSKVLRVAFEKGFNTSPDVAARLLAEEVHKEFISHKKLEQKAFDNLISVFRMLSCKDVFEAYHHLLLSRRILMLKAHIVEADEIFLKELRKQCGVEYTKRFDALFDDLQDSIKSFKEFKRETSPPDFFNALVLSDKSWPNLEKEPTITPPRDVFPILQQFSSFYNKTGKRKLQWNMRFTRVKLSCNGVEALKEVRCNGNYAVLLMMFNVSQLISITQIQQFTRLEKDEIEAMIKVLKGKRGGKLVTYMHQKIRINPEVITENGLIQLPFSFPQLSTTEKANTINSIQLNRDSQVDAAVMRIMKKEKSMEKDDLKVEVKEILNFRMEDELFDKRLSLLAQKIYLKIDPSGRIHYLP